MVIKLTRLRWARHEMRNEYKILVEESQGKQLLGRPRNRWKENINMVLEAVGFEGVDWIKLDQDNTKWRACEHGNKL
jgi:hypothetical protein